MKKVDQIGFTAIHFLLMLFLIGIIGFTGWKVYDSSIKTKSSLNDASKVETTVPKITEAQPIASTIPIGYVEYQNKEIGFKFVYPKEWGKVKLAAPINDGYSKYSNTISQQEASGPANLFLGFTDSKVALRSRSLQKILPPKGGDFLRNATGFCKNNDRYFLEDLNSKDVAGGYEPDGVKCGKVELVGSYSLSTSKLYIPAFKAFDHEFTYDITLGMFKVSHKEFPGWFVIDNEKTNNEAIKKLVESVKEL